VLSFYGDKKERAFSGPLRNICSKTHINMFHADPVTAELVTKPLVSGAIAAIADRYWFYGNMSTAAAFGAATAVGVAGADLLGRYALKNETLVHKSIETRAMEVVGSSALALMADRYVFEKDRTYEMPQRIGAVIASEVLAEYVVDSFIGMR
jgi:hypothetical protein